MLNKENAAMVQMAAQDNYNNDAEDTVGRDQGVSLFPVFSELFNGYEHAHGRYDMRHARKDPATGKVKGGMFTIPDPVVPTNWLDHLNGRGPGLGIIPLREDLTVGFGAIDLDTVGQNALRESIYELESRVRDLGLPLICCQSKSGGVHLYVFLKYPTDGRTVQRQLQEWASTLGYGSFTRGRFQGAEVFPKQTTRTSTEVGNWINLPYFGASRPAVINGEHASLETFVAEAQRRKVQIAEPIAEAGRRSASAKAQEGRNGFLFSRGCALRAAGFERTAIEAALGALNDAANEEVFTGKGSLDWSEVQEIIKNVMKYEAGASEDDTDALIDEMNRNHFVSIEGGRTLVFKEERDPETKRAVLVRPSFEDHRKWFCNREVRAGGTSRRPILATLGDFWLKSPRRRQYPGIVFVPNGDPGQNYNLWKGFAVDPIEGDWSLLREHIHQNICSGDDALFNYVMGWCATMIQKPGDPAEVALVMRGKRGTGKGTLAKALLRLLGQHGLPIANSKHLVGNFNAHLRDAVLVFADEAFWAGDKQGESVLKTLITEDMITVEAKHRDAVTVKNRIHMLIASNNDWAVPAGLEERRFCVLDVSERRMQDHTYFAAINEQLASGGLEAMLFELQNYDLSGFEVRNVPDTKALREQKMLSMDPETKWWFQKLWSGLLLNYHEKWELEVEKDKMYDDYIMSVGRTGVARRSVQTELALKLQKLLPSGYPKSHRRLVERKDDTGEAQLQRIPHWEFPALDECRRHFDQESRTAFDWPEEEEEFDVF